MSRDISQNSLTPQPSNNLNFGLAHDQVVHDETAMNYLCASQRQVNICVFFAVSFLFELGGMTKKHL